MVITAPQQAGIAIRRKRKSLNMTQRNLARRAGVSERLVSSLEMGDSPGIRLDKLLPVLSTLGLALEVKDDTDGSAAKDGKSTRLDAEYAHAFALFEEQLGVGGNSAGADAQADEGARDVR